MNNFFQVAHNLIPKLVNYVNLHGYNDLINSHVLEEGSTDVMPNNVINGEVATADISPSVDSGVYTSSVDGYSESSDEQQQPTAQDFSVALDSLLPATDNNQPIINVDLTGRYPTTTIIVDGLPIVASFDLTGSDKIVEDFNLTQLF